MVSAGSLGHSFESGKRRLRARLAHHPALMRLVKAPIAIARRVLGAPHEDDFRQLGSLQLAADEVVVDIGANHGQSIRSIRSIRLFQRRAPIVAFEPNPILAQELRRRFAGDPGVSVVNVGLGATAGELVLRIPVYGKTMYDGLASFAAEAATSDAIADQFADFDTSKLSYCEHRCAVETLDSRGHTAGFIKIDVEGFEAAVLEGALATLRRTRPVLLIEDGSRAAIHELLEPLGYVPFAYEKGSLVAGGVSARNTWFIHPEAPRGLLPGRAA